MASGLYPSGQTQLVWGSLSASSPTAECLLESSLPARRGKRQEVRQRLGTQLRQPRAPFPPPALGLWGRGSPGRKAELPPAERHTKLPPPPAILPQSLSILYLHLAPFLGHGLLSLCGHSQPHAVGRHPRPSCQWSLSGDPVHRQTPAYLPPFRKSFLLSDLSPSCCGPGPHLLVLNL